MARIGILADIHGHVNNLKSALSRLHEEGVDRIVLLGDVIESRRNARATVALLTDHNAAGVWGNHELGLCIEPDEAIRADYGGPVLDFFASLVERYEVGDLLFSHTLPSQDLSDPAAYYLGARPYENGALEPSFDRFHHRIFFIGHFHRWFASTPEEQLDWVGDEPLHFEPQQRYFVVVHAVLNGWCAVFDESEDMLLPLSLNG